ncbi:invasion associated locus B family protein [Nitratireductor soli]|uniref:invasion associated locus B family protein n=1 Tax=Nitratireductor soli TaxID=1670619 RepID=UPI001FCD0FA6|nr:invasion associated locus B family protein [Nitratireductor soli]
MGSAGSVAAQGLPGGATSLNETHGDWTVGCRTAEGAVRCAMTQTQVSGENRQRILAVELAAAEGGNAASGVLVLPFGLRLDSGVRLAIDETSPREPLRFSTCLPAGCIAPLVFDAATVTALKAGTAVSVTVTANDSGQELAFSISLSGFSSALNRIAELNGS